MTIDKDLGKDDKDKAADDAVDLPEETADADEADVTEAAEVEAGDEDKSESEDKESADDEAADDEAADDEADDEADEKAGEETDEDEPAKSRKDNRWVRYAIVAAVVAVFLGGLGACGYFGWDLWKERQVTQAGEDAREAAVNYAQVLTSIDSAKVDENFNEVLEGATGEFKDMYSQSSVQLRQLLIDNKAAAHGVVVDSAIQSESKDKVVVLLFIDQTVTNTARPDPRVDRSRMKMTMEMVDGRWRASKVELP